jgi:hypothetical protein
MMMARITAQATPEQLRPLRHGSSRLSQISHARKLGHHWLGVKKFGYHVSWILNVSDA